MGGQNREEEVELSKYLISPENLVKALAGSKEDLRAENFDLNLRGGQGFTINEGPNLGAQTETLGHERSEARMQEKTKEVQRPKSNRDFQAAKIESSLVKKLADYSNFNLSKNQPQSLAGRLSGHIDQDLTFFAKKTIKGYGRDPKTHQIRGKPRRRNFPRLSQILSKNGWKRHSLSLLDHSALNLRYNINRIRQKASVLASWNSGRDRTQSLSEVDRKFKKSTKPTKKKKKQ